MLQFLLPAIIGAGTQMYMGNRARQDQNNLMNQLAGQKIDPVQVGTDALNAQGQLAPNALNLNNQYAPQFAASNNNALLSSLFGSPNLPGATNALTGNSAFSGLSPQIQNYLSGVANTQGMGAIGNMLGGDPYQAMLQIYQGTGGKLGTEEDAANFNNWVTQNFGDQWHKDGTGGPALDQLGKDLGGTKSPGIAEMIGALDKQLNPGQQAALDALKGAAAVPSATVTAPGVNVPGMAMPGAVNQSGAAASLGAFMNNGTAPQVQGPQGVNQGMEHLANMLGSSSYMPVNAAQMQGVGGANLAGNAALAAGPQMGPANLSQAPVNINAPQGFERIFANTATPQVNAPTSFQQVQGPQGFERVNAPGQVANINAPGNIAAQQVSAPNVALDRVAVGQNTLLNNLQNQGFNANRPIQNTLESQAQSDLALGGQLSGDQARLAQQAARAASEARGMAGSNSAILGEVQRQLDMSRALQNERRQFAQGVEAQGFGQLATQQGNAINAAGVTNQYLGLGLDAAKANNASALDLGKLGLQAGMANQAANLDAARANQGTQLQTSLANQQAGIENNRLGLQAGLANQQAGLDLSRLGLQAGMANQQAGLDLGRMGLTAQQANQQAAMQGNQLGLQASQANQAAGLDLSRMGLQAQTSNAANQLANNQFNAGQQNDMARLLAQLGLQAGQFNAGQQNQMSQFNAGQQDNAMNRQMTVNQTNANLAQQAALANQGAFQQNWQNQTQAANSLANLFNTLQAQSQDAQQANQNAWLGQRGQTMSGLQALLNSDNQLGMFNAGQTADANRYNAGLGADMAKFNAGLGFDAARFNAGQQQQDFANQLAYQQAVAQSRFDPMAAMGFANGQMNWGMFDPFNPAIMSMYAANNQNAANAMMGAANNRAAINSGLIQGIGNIAGGVFGAINNGKG